METKVIGGEHSKRWSLEGMTALVTGGTKGIGNLFVLFNRHAIVEELSRLGAILHTCARNEADLDACLLYWKAKGLQISDVTSRTQREKLMETVNSIFHGRLHILVNNAGAPLTKETVNYKEEDFSSVMALNFESIYHLSQLAYPMLKASGQGNIIFISSIVSLLLMLGLFMDLQKEH